MFKHGSKLLPILLTALAITATTPTWCQNEAVTASSQQGNPSSQQPQEATAQTAQDIQPEQPSQFEEYKEAFIESYKLFMYKAADQLHRMKETMQRWNYQLNLRKQNAERKEARREREKQAAEAYDEAEENAREQQQQQNR